MALIFTAHAAYSADRSGKAEPILSGSAKAACNPALDQADMTPGVDVDGRPVAGAELPAAPVRVEAQVAVPLKPVRGRAGNPAYVMVDGRKLDPLLNPPACR